ncbi:RNA polymerase sigma factor [Pedobacter sp.]|uniref:RNA polymerase sigma factor n=1 Tax=Pedobacter sp. TaxID=1411316 RepID=UPI00396CCD9B
MKIHFENNDDATLFALLKQGDENAFVKIYHKYWKELFNAAYKRLPEKEQCQDIIQNVFVDLWNRRNELDLRKPLAYLHTAVRFQVLKFISRDSKKGKFFNVFDEEIISPLKTDETVLEKEVKLIVELFIATLPKKRRQIFEMYYLDGLKVETIATTLDISEKTVRNQLAAAGKLLKLRITNMFLLLVIVFFLL